MLGLQQTIGKGGWWWRLGRKEVSGRHDSSPKEKSGS